jgi:hypothetical protein
MLHDPFGSDLPLGASLSPAKIKTDTGRIADDVQELVAVSECGSNAINRQVKTLNGLLARIAAATVGAHRLW